MCSELPNSEKVWCPHKCSVLLIRKMIRIMMRTMIMTMMMTIMVTVIILREVTIIATTWLSLLSPRWSLSQLLCGSFQLRFVLQCSKFCILGAQFISPSIYYTLTVSVALIKQIFCACNNTMRYIRFILVVDFKTLMFKSRLG